MRPPLVLCNVSVADVPLRDVIPAASRVGFEAISVVGSSVRRSIDRDGVAIAELCALLTDHGLAVTDVEAVADWLGPLPPDTPRWLAPGLDEDGFLDLAAAMGAQNLVAVHFGPMPRRADASLQFARLCDRAAERGVRVALEYPAMATISDVVTAWDVVAGAERSTAGLVHDIWHHDRSCAGAVELAAVPVERILSIQLADAAPRGQRSLMEDVRHRQLLGEGDLRPADQLRELLSRGANCPVGIEVFTAFDQRPPLERIQELYDNLLATVEEAEL